MENDSILTRVNELLSDYSLKPSQFAVKIGYDTSTFAKALKEDGRGITDGIKFKICLHLGINPQWLEDGLGDKYSNGNDESFRTVTKPIKEYDSLAKLLVVQSQIAGEYKGKYEQLQSMYDELKLKYEGEINSKKADAV